MIVGAAQLRLSQGRVEFAKAMEEDAKLSAIM